MIGHDTYAYRQRLPHLQREFKTYFVTFCTKDRRLLEPLHRDVVLRECVAAHSETCWLHSVVAMPDHAHLLVTLAAGHSLPRWLQMIKGRSARTINSLIGRRGPLWQRESFDHILRRAEDVREKAEYIANNPVRAGLVARPEDYKWYWRNPASV